MHPLEQEILALCRAHALLTPGDRLVLGVSGGADSMALLQVLARLAPQLDITMVVAHVDHGLRPSEAAAEESLVRRATTSWGLKCLTAHLDVAGHAKDRGLSLEEAARHLRYEFFATMANTHAANKIAVAHTADDQAEEILLRLIRGTGRKGLAGMTLVREGTIVRPFLTTPKARILSYLKARELVFATDSSNADRRYLRNKIRLDLLPYLTQFNPNIKQTLRQTASILRDEDAVLETMVEEACAQLVFREETAQGAKFTLVCSQFNGLQVAIRRRLIERILNALEAKFGYQQINRLLSMAEAEPSSQLHLKNGLLAVTKQGEMHLFYPSGKQAGRQRPVDDAVSFHLVVPQPGRYLIPELNREIIVELLTGLPSQTELRDAKGDFLDADTVTFPLVLRNRLPGDRFQPMNSQGHKKVTDLLIDLKVPLAERDRLPVLLSANRIVAIPGLRIADGVKVTAPTTRVLKII